MQEDDEFDDWLYEMEHEEEYEEMIRRLWVDLSLRTVETELYLAPCD